MKNWLGQAIVTDYIGKSVMRWITYALSLEVGFAAWARADAVQNVDSLDMPLAAFILVTIVYAYVISQPFFGGLLVILIEQLVGQLGILDSSMMCCSLWNSQVLLGPTTPSPATTRTRSWASSFSTRCLAITFWNFIESGISLSSATSFSHLRWVSSETTPIRSPGCARKRPPGQCMPRSAHRGRRGDLQEAARAPRWARQLLGELREQDLSGLHAAVRALHWVIACLQRIIHEREQETNLDRV